jgi:type I restriction enzyme S subunit
MAVPKIRFPEFTDDWEQRKLGDIASSFAYGLNAAAKEFDGKHKYLRITDIDDVSRVFQDDNLTSPDADIDAADDYRLEEGDLLFARTGASVGKSYIYKESDGLVYYAGFLIRAKIRPEYDAEFVFQNTLTSTYEKYIKTTSQRSGQPGVNAKEYAEYSMSLPEYAEQVKIGMFLRKIDDAITLHQRKLDDLRLLKKSMLQKMFPKEGKDVPETRFPGFTDAWEQRKLSSLFDKFDDGDWIEAKDQSDSGVRLIQTGNVGITEFIDKPDNKKWISEDTFERLHCEEIFPGDILISRLPEPAGRACIVPDTGTRMITAVDCTIAHSSSENSAEFIVQYLSSSDYFKWVNTCLAGGTRQRISRRMLSGCDVMIPPTLAEQKCVGVYFSNLDNLITLHQRKLEDLQKLKKALLQQMFC